MPLNIKDPATDRLVRELASVTGESITDAVATAVRERLDRLVAHRRAGTLLEVGIVVEARRGEAAGRELDLLLHRLGATVVPVDEAQATAARSAWRRFGKGRDAAGLNLGDCFAYALARLTGEPLLCKGDDFRLTDAALAR